MQAGRIAYPDRSSYSLKDQSPLQTKKNNQTDNQKSLELRSKSQEEAIQKAIEQLNVDKEDIEDIEDIKVEVIEEPSKGFLGFIGAKDGLYKITLIEKQIEIKEIDIAKEFIEKIGRASCRERV